MNRKAYHVCSFVYLKQALELLTPIFEKISKDNSPYSFIPLLSQILGLNAPLMGEGDSPYSITSISFLLKGKSKILNSLYSIPFQEKRNIINEIYDFIAPIILEEDNEYIDLLMQTKYEKQFNRLNPAEKKEFKKTLCKKKDLIKSFVFKFLSQKGDFIHLAHYGYQADLYREYDFLNGMSTKAEELWFNNSYPVVAEMVLKKTKRTNNGIKKQIKGWAILISNSTEQLLKDGKLRKRKIFQAARLGQRLGAKISGMGGLIASFAGGGFYLSKEVKGVGFTTGHAYTIANIAEIVDKVLSKTNMKLEKLNIAIVGAAGSIGSGCAKILSKKNINRLLLVDTTSFISSQKLNELKQHILKMKPRIDIITTGNLSDIRKADLVIVATNSPFSIIKSVHLKKGAIVIDDSFPKNVSYITSQERKDVLFLEGGAVQLPLDLEVYMARNMPDLIDAPLTRLVSCRELYSSFSETVILAFNKHYKNYGLGNADIVLAKDITEKADKVEIKPAALQFFGQAVDPKRFDIVEKTYKKRFA